MWRKVNPCVLLVGMWISTATKKNSMEVLQKLENRTAIFSSNPTSVYISKWNGSRILKRYLKEWPRDWKRSVFIPIPMKGNAKECSNYHTIALISQASKIVLKILQARLQQYVNHELPNVQAGFRKGRGTRDQIANIHWIMEKARDFQKKTSISALFTMPKLLTVWITINCGKFWKRWEYQATWPASWETYMQVRKQQLELGMEQ